MFGLNIDKLFLTFVFLIPLMPRATSLGPERWVVPALMVLLIGGWIINLRRVVPFHGSNLQLLALILGFSIAAFVFRVLVHGELELEYPRIIARILFAVGLVAMTHWLCSTTIAKKTVFKAFLLGFLTTSLLTVFCGITGIQILEEDSIKPSRFFGLYKSTGIFRSFGEFGIMGGIAWTYLIIYARRLTPSFWLLAATLVLMALLVAQSRNVYFTWLVVTLLATTLLLFRLPKFLYAFLAVFIVLLPVVVEFSIPILQETSFGNKIVGTGTILERNVDVRFDQYGDALVMASRDPSSALLGCSRQSWEELMLETHGNVIAPHNHFLSNVVFSGLIGGGVWICGLFIFPCILLSQSIDTEDPIVAISLVSLVGAMVGLSFYEGFFSVVVMLAIAMAWSVGFSQLGMSPTQAMTTDSHAWFETS